MWQSERKAYSAMGGNGETEILVCVDPPLPDHIWETDRRQAWRSLLVTVLTRRVRQRTQLKSAAAATTTAPIEAQAASQVL